MFDSDIRHMRHALALGKRGRGICWPNPCVGCVVVKNDRVVGRGWTGPGGRPHAETIALGQAGILSVGATAYVSLEPCSHYGKTPPCADALINAGIARVVSTIEDPDPRVGGRGFAKLREAGIKVDTGLLSAEAKSDLSGFLTRMQTGKPRITLKLATSLDGKIATQSGQSKWITGSSSRRVVHEIRSRHDAVLVGAGTIRADNPMLTVRGMGIESQPVRIALTCGIDIPANSNLAQTAKEIPLWICHGADAVKSVVDRWKSLGAVMIECGNHNGRLCINTVLDNLGDRGLTHILCEGGGGLASSLLKNGLVSDLICFTAGVAIGEEGISAMGGMEIDVLGEAPRFGLMESRIIGEDVMHRWSAI